MRAVQAKNADSAKMAKPKTTELNFTPAAEALISEALAIEAESAADAGALGYMARAMVQATLPHKKVDGNEFTRTNGSYTLSIMAPAKIGLPYGTIPRLLLGWVTTEAVRTKSRELELSDSMSSFMAELGLGRRGGARGDITRLKDQTRRLFASTVSAIYEGGERTTDMGFRLADKTEMWWHAKDPDQALISRSTILLTEPFFREIVDRPVPVDMRALQALKRSPLALDIYCWSTYRSSYIKQASTIPWPALAAQFGSDYKVLRQFKAAFLGELKKVVTVYAGARFEEADDGLIVKPGKPHIPRRPAS